MAWKQIDARATLREVSIPDPYVRVDAVTRYVVVSKRCAAALALQEGAHYAVFVDRDEQLIGIKEVPKGDATEPLRPVSLNREGQNLRFGSSELFRALGLSRQVRFMCKAYRQDEMVVFNLKEKVEYRKPGDGLGGAGSAAA